MATGPYGGFKSAVEEIEDILHVRQATAQAAATTYLGEPPEQLAVGGGPNPDVVYVRPVVTNPLDPVDDQVVVLLASDGGVVPEDQSPYTPTNPDDPVSPALESQSTGAKPADPDDLHAFPDDPSLTPPAPAPAPPSAPAPEPSP